MAYQAFLQSSPGSIGDAMSTEDMDNVVLIQVGFLQHYRMHGTRRTFQSEQELTFHVLQHFHTHFGHRASQLPRPPERNTSEVIG